MKTLFTLLKLFLIAGIALSLLSCSKKDNGIGNSGGKDYLLTTPVSYRGDVPQSPESLPIPQVLQVYAPFVGVWQNQYSGKTFVMLADGRIAFQHTGEQTDIGVYTPATTDRFNFNWLLEDAEQAGMYSFENQITIAGLDYDRVGSAADAEAAYSQLYDGLLNEAQDNNAKHPVGTIGTATADPHDPNPKSIIPGAKVYTSEEHFQASFTSTKWYDMPDGKIEGFDGYSRTDMWLLPTGRFFMQMYLWDEVNPQNKIESYRHYASWGKYTVIKGSDALMGDIINCYYDNGGTAAYKTAGGQSCFLVKGVVYHFR